MFSRIQQSKDVLKTSNKFLLYKNQVVINDYQPTFYCPKILN